MARRRRGRRPPRRRRTLWIVVSGGIVLLAGWFFWPRSATPEPQPVVAAGAATPLREARETPEARVAQAPAARGTPLAATREPVGASAPGAVEATPVAPTGRASTSQPAAPSLVGSSPPPPSETDVRLASDPSGQATPAGADDLIARRGVLNRRLAATRDADEARRLRQRLMELADRTIFSREVFGNDPLVETYVVQPGETLTVIARRYKVSPEIIMRINGIRDARRLRAGQRIKVPHGPFHVRIVKHDFRLDLYLQDLFVRSFKVGLGANGGTPTGTWKVKNRLKNPTYFPPSSSPEKRVIPADDPRNPLGEYWIGLEGISGEALQAEGYGIHGTIDPDSIGRNVSLGCVRMHNDDVAFVFACVRPGESTVTIVP